MISCQIAQLRRCIGLSQSQLAHKLHITPSALGMYEQGRRMPSIDVLIQMSNIFNVSLDYLITGAEFIPASHHGGDSPYSVNSSCCQCCCKKLLDYIQEYMSLKENPRT